MRKRDEIVFEVRAAAGYYEDASDWLVAAYRARSEAEAHVAAATIEEKRIEEWARGDGNWQYLGDPADPKSPYDPGSDSRGGATYYVREVPVSLKFRRRRAVVLPPSLPDPEADEVARATTKGGR